MTFRAVRCVSRFTTKPLLVVIIAVALLVPASPTGAIIGGAPDGNGHPYVAAVGPPRPIVASGVLISPNVVLTAAHVAARRLGPGAARVTFDPDAKSASATWYTGTAHLHPAYDPRRGDDPHDLAVIVLHEPVAGITPASLPTEGLLDELGPQGLQASTFELVGYGVSRLIGGENGGGQPDIDRTSGGTRKVAEEDFVSLTPAWFSYVEHQGGQSCSGDSGSPVLFGGSDRVVAINILGDPTCQNFGRGMRVDTASARAFIGQYVALP